jgi:DNA polymerase III delta prime subunit
MSKFDRLWEEKYRPSKLDDLILPDNLRKKFEAMRGGKIPHMLLVCPSGRGKTSLAKIIATELTNSEYLYINASDKNSVDDVRNEIKTFAETASVFNDFKIIILDEADRLSAPAQDALRNIIETFADNVRFILTANKRSAITDAINSRMHTIDNFTLPFDQCFKRSCEILDAEGVSYDEEVVKSILRKSLPDFRIAVRRFQYNFDENELTEDDGSEEEAFQKLVSLIWSAIKLPKYTVEQIRELCISKENEFPSYEILAQTIHSHIFRNEEDKKLQRKATILIADFLQHAGKVMDVELSFYALVIKLRQLTCGEI